ncbi:MAG: hypothetical protein AAF206_07965 [Bacteroidota bacterium]
MFFALLQEWVLPLAISASFLYAIFMLLSGRWAKKFARWGYLPWFRWFLLMLHSTIIISLFLTGPLQRLGIALGIVVVIGALFTLSRNFVERKEYIYPTISLVLLLSFLGLIVQA